MQMYELTIEGHGHNILAESESVEQDQTGLESLLFGHKKGLQLTLAARATYYISWHL